MPTSLSNLVDNLSEIKSVSDFIGLNNTDYVMNAKNVKKDG